jgi:hypothetical protein
MKIAKSQGVNDQPNAHGLGAAFVQCNRDGSTEGKDPRTMPRELLLTIHERMPLSQVIRARCLDCCAHLPSEVRKCTAVDCVSWPYRMGRNPFSDRKANPAALEALAKARAAKNSGDGGEFDDSYDFEGAEGNVGPGLAVSTLGE